MSGMNPNNPHGNTPTNSANGSSSGSTPQFPLYFAASRSSRSNSAPSQLTHWPSQQMDIIIDTEDLSLQGPSRNHRRYASPISPMQVAGPSTSASYSAAQQPVSPNDNEENNINVSDGFQCTRKECLNRQKMVGQMRNKRNEAEKRCTQIEREKNEIIRTLQDEITRLRSQLHPPPSPTVSPSVSPSKRCRF